MPTPAWKMEYERQIHVGGKVPSLWAQFHVNIRRQIEWTNWKWKKTFDRSSRLCCIAVTFERHQRLPSRWRYAINNSTLKKIRTFQEN